MTGLISLARAIAVMSALIGFAGGAWRIGVAVFKGEKPALAGLALFAALFCIGFGFALFQEVAGGGGFGIIQILSSMIAKVLAIFNNAL